MDHQAAGPRRIKKSPSLAALGQVCAAWEETRHSGGHDHIAVRDLRLLAGNLSAWQLTPLHLTSIVARWRENYSPATAYHRTTALRRFLRFLHASGGPKLDTEVPRVPKPPQRHRVASNEEQDRLLAHANALMRIAVMLMLDTACRPGETLSIFREHYNPDTGVLTVPQLKDHDPKLLPASPRLTAWITAWPETPPATPLLQLAHGKPVSYNLLAKQWTALKKKAGVRYDLRLHDLRRTTATNLQHTSGDISAVQQLLGHRTLHATARYIAHLDPRKMRALLAQLWRPTPTEVTQ